MLTLMDQWEAVEVDADVHSSNIDFEPTVDSKTVCDGYERLQRNSDLSNCYDSMASGMRGDLSETLEILFIMPKGRVETIKEKARRREEEKKRRREGEKARLQDIMRAREKRDPERIVANATASAPYVLGERNEEGVKAMMTQLENGLKKLSFITQQSTARWTASWRLRNNLKQNRFD